MQRLSASSSTRLMLCDFSRDVMGMRILRIGQVNCSLNRNESEFLMTLPPAALPSSAMRFSTFYLPHVSECITRLMMSSGIASSSIRAVNVMAPGTTDAVASWLKATMTITAP